MKELDPIDPHVVLRHCGDARTYHERTIPYEDAESLARAAIHLLEMAEKALQRTDAWGQPIAAYIDASEVIRVFGGGSDG